jgi:hypothetical protein
VCGSCPAGYSGNGIGASGCVAIATASPTHSPTLAPTVPTTPPTAAADSCNRQAILKFADECTDADPVRTSWAACPRVCGSAVVKYLAEFGCCFALIWEPILASARTTLPQLLAACALPEPCAQQASSALAVGLDRQVDEATRRTIQLELAARFGLHPNEVLVRVDLTDSRLVTVTHSAPAAVQAAVLYELRTQQLDVTRGRAKVLTAAYANPLEAAATSSRCVSDSDCLITETCQVRVVAGVAESVCATAPVTAQPSNPPSEWGAVFEVSPTDGPGSRIVSFRSGESSPASSLYHSAFAARTVACCICHILLALTLV